MVKLIHSGTYKLKEIVGHAMYLVLNNKTVYTLATVQEEWHTLFLSLDNAYKRAHLLGSGKYYLYNVSTDQRFTSGYHLELEIGKKTFQGYLLTNALPKQVTATSLVVPTHEVITHNSRLATSSCIVV